MLHPTRLDPRTADDVTADPPADAVPKAPPTSAGQGRWLRRARIACQRRLAALGAVLARAERHITENFKVPPHGG
ncbi:hypothetical protein [Acidovorax sp. Root267]|uniref:hypothetical protein n=1 Tax=Acidovorax sp. Root267 TaxID=1736505 RepID=UPI000AA1EFFC|nr:hypothetical protein [Acidovorax sp. Root267]